MDDLISRWSAIDALTDTNLKRNVDSLCDGDMNRTRRAAQRVIAQLPTVDAVPVVRCKDCIHLGEDYYCMLNWVIAKPDWYCADGERREDEHGNG